MDKKGLALKVAILCIGLIPVEVAQIVQPILGEITKAFPGNPIAVSLVVTLPQLMLIIFGTVGGKLTGYVSKKSLLIFGLICYIVGGVGPFAVHSTIAGILVMRAIMGIGAGLTIPLNQGLIADYYEGQERASLMGISFAIGSVGGTVLTILAGYIALTGFQNVFLLYLMFVIVLVIELLWLPSVKVGVVVKDGSVTAEKPRLNGNVWIMAGITFLVAIMINSFFLEFAIMIMSQKLGSPALIGQTLGGLTILAFLSGLCFKYVYGALKDFILALATIVMAVAYFTVSGAHGVPPLYIGAALFGIGMGWSIPYFFTRVAMLTDEISHSYATGFVNSAFYLGAFISTFTLAWALSTFGHNIRSCFVLFAVVLIIYAIVAGIVVGVNWKRLNALSPPTHTA